MDLIKKKLLNKQFFVTKMKILTTKKDLTLLRRIKKYEDLISTYYPNYREWFQTKMLPGILQGTREIIAIEDSDGVVAFISLKKEEERKICTLYVDKKYRKKGLGTILVKKGLEYLETPSPLLTIPADKIKMFKKMIKKYNWKITASVDNEIIVNGRNKVYLKK